MNTPVDSPAALARFPAEVRAAYSTFITRGDTEALPVLINAALTDFLPKRPGAAHPRKIEDRARLMEDLGYDSLAIAELVFFFEDLFKVTIHTQELRQLATVGELRTFVAHKLAATSRTA